MAYFLGFLLALVSIALLARPILRREQTASGHSVSLEFLEDMQWLHQQVHEEIRTLILDHELGNMPSEEYEDKLGAYRLRAANLLLQQAQILDGLTSLENEMEDTVLALRMSWGTVKGVSACGGCGEERDLDAVLCPRCEIPEETVVGNE
ncbi:hypothetical protein FIM08_03290 [SAR202 cluster bacterium AC-647-N09_OGT_505m]|nr:hypothetical protein [SAR202 cluster bacterium AC-647-N09_OGT_505m]